jgi:Flp pilus assembly CpaF family ATPase
MNVDNKTPDKEYDSSLNNMFTTVLKQSIDNAAVGEVRGSEVNELLKGMYFQNKMSKRDIGESR